MNSFVPQIAGLKFTPHTLTVVLATGAELMVNLEGFPRLHAATQAQRSNWRRIGVGEGLHWPDLDEDISVLGLLGMDLPSDLTTVSHATFTTAVIERDGKKWMVDDRRAHVPLESVKPAHKLEDELVRKIFAHAEPLSAQVARFMVHTMADLNGHDELLAQEYKVKRRGKKGNRTYQSYDGLMKVQVQVADVISFGPELQQAKSLIDECLNSWSEDSQAELRVFVTQAFDVDKEGKVRPAELFRLRRFDIQDERWLNAMRAIDDAVRPRGTKQYVRFYKRATTDDDFEPVTIDLARA